MTTSALYDLNTGFITGGTVTPALTNAAQITALQGQGLGVVTIPDGKDGGTGMIDLSTTTYTDFVQQTAIPNIQFQLVSALINAGVIPSASFHPVTLAVMNNSLSAVSMSAINTDVSIASKAN